MRIIARILFGFAWLAATGTIMEALPLPGGFRFIGAFLIASALMPVAIAAHELGHAWAVRRLGGKVVSFNILGAEFVDSAPPPDPRLGGHEIGGYVGYVFEGGETRHEAIRIALAGPAANLLLGVAAGLLAFLAAHSPSRQVAITAPVNAVAAKPATDSPRFDGPMLPSEAEVRQWLDENPQWKRGWSLSNLLAMILTALAALSVGAALANLIPFKGSDGAAIWHASRPAWRR